MQAVEHQPWRISVHAKAKNFNMKFRASKVLPNWRSCETRLSILLMLRGFVLKVKSETGDSARKRRGTFKSKVLRIIEKLCRVRVKNKIIAGKKNLNLQETNFRAKRWSQFDYEESSICSLVIGNLALLSRSVSEKDQGEIAIHTFAILFYLALLCKNYINRRNNNLLVILITCMTSLIEFYVRYLNYVSHLPDWVWKAWSHVTPLGCFYVFTRVIFSRVFLYMGKDKLIAGLFLSALPPIFLFMVNQGLILFKTIESYLVAKVLLTGLTVSQLGLADKGSKTITLAIFISTAPLWMKEIGQIGHLFANY